MRAAGMPKRIKPAKLSEEVLREDSKKAKKQYGTKEPSKAR
jgi:hypothetical protein